MTVSNDLLERSVHRFALAMALAVAVVIPLGYWLVTQRNFSDALDFKARVKAAALSGAIASNPDTWMFAENRMLGLLGHEPVPLQDENLRVYARGEELVAEVGDSPAAPLLRRAYPLHDAGQVVGQLVITGSLRPLLLNTLAVSLLGLLLSLMVYAVMKLLPLRALRSATAALSASERRFRSIFESVPNVAVRGYDTGQRIIFWNPASERLYGYSVAEAIGERIDALIVPPEARPALAAALGTWFAGGPPIAAGETTLQRKDGSPVVVYSSHAMLTDADGKPEIYSIDVELTELKRTEAELRSYQAHLEDMVNERTLALSIAKEAAEAANRAKSRFLANMSHELRTPMNAVIGMLGLAQSHMSDRQGLDQLEKARTGADHLLAVINNILDLSKIEAERFTLDETDFTLGSVLDRLDALIGQRAAEKGLALTIQPAPGLAARSYRGDPLRLGQILVNLVGNAVKFTERGAIRVGVREVAATADGALLRFEIEDHGIGIAAGERERLFSAFEQADGSMTRKYGGSGLGLAISKQLVRMMGGEIDLESVPGEGSTFWFTVRLGLSAAVAADSASAPAAAETLKRKFTGASILLAEDEPVSREVALLLLRDRGLVVDLAADGVEAVRRATERRYDLILMDMQMPAMNGVDATRSIRSHSQNSGTPILALTANAFAEDRQACLDAGMNDHIAKPIDSKRLFATLLRWLEQSSGAVGGATTPEA